MITVIPNVIPYAPRECVGPLQARVLDRLAASTFRPYLVMPRPGAERRALNRLVARGLLQPALGYPGAFTVTEYGNSCNWAVNR